MATKIREEHVGKRFLCVSSGSGGKPKLSRLTEWNWMAGIIRCATHVDSSDRDLQFLVEFDDKPWQSRDWLNVYKDNFHVLLVEDSLCLTNRSTLDATTASGSSRSGSLQPALTFKPLVDNIDLWRSKQLRPIEFITDQRLDFQDVSKLKIIRSWDGDINGIEMSDSSRRCVKQWAELQDGQHILITTPSVLLGFRIQVYRAEGATQWYTAVTTAYNEDSGEFTVTDDTILEEHYEDPRLTQMKLIGDGVIESILKGENVGITPRRCRSSVTRGSQTPRLTTFGRKFIKFSPRKTSKSSSFLRSSSAATKKAPFSSSSLSSPSTSSPQAEPSKGSKSSLQAQTAITSAKKRGRRRKRPRSNSNEVELQQASPLFETDETDKKAVTKEEKPAANFAASTTPSSSSSLSLPELRKKQQQQQQQSRTAGKLQQEKHPLTKKDVTSRSLAKLRSVHKSKDKKIKIKSRKLLEDHDFEEGEDEDEGQEEEEDDFGTDNVIKGKDLAKRREDLLPLNSKKESKVLKRKAVAIVRPQPQQQQHQHDKESDINKTSLSSSKSTKPAASTSSSSSSSTSSSQSSSKSTENKEKKEEKADDRQSRFSLYDFPSDSESEAEKSEKAAVIAAAAAKNKKFFTPSSNTDKKKLFSSPSVDFEKRKEHQEQHQQISRKSTTTDLRILKKPLIQQQIEEKQEGEPFKPVEAENCVEKLDLDESKAKDGLRRESSKVVVERSKNFKSSSSNSSSNNNNNNKNEDNNKMDDDRSDSGVSTLRSDGARSSGDERSGSRSSALSSDEQQRSKNPAPPSPALLIPQLQTAPKNAEISKNISSSSSAASLTASSSSVWRNSPSATDCHRMNDHPPPGGGGSGVNSGGRLSTAPLLPPISQPGTLSLPPTQQPPSAAAATAGAPPPTPPSQSISQAAAHLSALTVAQYQAAALQVGLVPPHHAAAAAAASGLSPHLLAQYQSLAAAGIPPEVLLKQQYPQLAAAAAAATAVGVPPHLLGRNPATDYAVLGRGRELAADRERTIRERHEAELRERERLEKERKEERERREREDRERRLERERRERQKEYIQKQQAVEAVDHHFQLSMELAKKLPNYGRYIYANQKMGGASQHWSQLPGLALGKTPQSSSLENEERRKYEEHQRRQQQQQHNHHHQQQQQQAEDAERQHIQYMNVMASAAAAAANNSRHSAQVSSQAPPPAHGNKQQQQPPKHQGVPPPMPGSYMPPHYKCPSSKDPTSRSSSVGFKPYETYSSSSRVPSSMSPVGSGQNPSPGLSAVSPPTAMPGGYGYNSITTSSSAVAPPQPPFPPTQPALPPAPPVVAPSPAPRKGASPALGQVYGRPTATAAPSATTTTSTQPPPAHGAPHRSILPPIVVAPPPLTAASQLLIPTAAAVEDVPLDLGAPLKRRAVEQQQPLPQSTMSTSSIGNSIQSADIPVPPKKTAKVEIAPSPSLAPPLLQGQGILYKVSKPSVLVTSEPTTINTVVNSALSNVVVSANPTVNSTNEQSRPANQFQQQNCHENSNSVSESDAVDPAAEFGYVHKLKRAWMKANNDNSTTTTMAAISTNNSPNPLSTTSSARATPSPALSNKSTNSSKGAGRRGSGTPLINGHSSPNSKSKIDADSNVTSSDSEHSVTTNNSNANATTKKRPGKKCRKGRPGPKPKAGRKKASVTASATVSSESNSGSESEGDKESSSAERIVAPLAKKRGRKPGSSSKKVAETGKINSIKNAENRRLQNSHNPFQKPSFSQLKKTGESFLQDASCFEVAPKLAKCRECRWTQSQRNKKMPNIFCRFYAFRRLRYTKNGQLTVAGFCHPARDAGADDLNVWSISGSKSQLSRDQARLLLSCLKKEFSAIMYQERQAKEARSAADDTVAWKRVVQGVREMCDVCDATLFNFHWACNKCGFVVCLDCYLSRKDNVMRSWSEDAADNKDLDKFSWLLCTNRQQHELDKLMLTQIVAGSALEDVNNRFLDLCDDDKRLNGINRKHNENISEKNSFKMSDLIERTIENSMENTMTKENHVELKHFIRKCNNDNKKATNGSSSSNLMSIKAFTLNESTLLYPNVQHTWLCDGKVLKMATASEDKSLDLFREVWRRRVPVVIADACSKMNKKLWTPESLLEDFGELKVGFVHALNGSSLGSHSLKKFFNGFSDLSKRMKDEEGEPLLLKVKGWPPSGGEEFSEALPSRTSDLLKSLPFSVYTSPASPLNLASSLPDVFVRPDLGPRAWLTYGSVTKSNLGTVNLHLEVADSLNLLVYTSGNENPSEEKFLKELGCESKASDPAAVWHIFHPSDADKIRDLLNREFLEKPDFNYDLIHEESKYLDARLREKLYNEYGVTPFTVVQKHNEAVVVPAGAPRQCKHLKSSIALSVDFISPESLPHSFQLVQDMWNLSESQTMSEDKLQVKNIIFHSVKDALKAIDADNNSNGKCEIKTEGQEKQKQDD